jgi:hypothetical protein
MLVATRQNVSVMGDGEPSSSCHFPARSRRRICVVMLLCSLSQCRRRDQTVSTNRTSRLTTSPTVQRRIRVCTFLSMRSFIASLDLDSSRSL